ncbi:MAG: CDP-alcohol phosphatidyltransferase family protein [Oscillospiraceae bacterium]|nr:CDP-alcohol phosphatidyltransferase family protein [Oscillospiraceae bacterium]
MKKIFQGKILTLPNLLSCFRLLLIPCFIWTYLVWKDSGLTVLILALSGLTDVIDGWIARRFNMISNLGKALDPLADKLTQAAMLACLMTRFPRMLIPLLLMVVKELFCISTGLAAIRRTGEVRSSDWHGKAATVTLYALLILHVLWPGLPQAVSLAALSLSSGMILLSGVLYGVQNIRQLRRGREEGEKSEVLLNQSAGDGKTETNPL